MYSVPPHKYIVNVNQSPVVDTIVLLTKISVPFPVDLIPAICKNSVNPDTIFANNEMSLGDIEIYGFDYDYTLAFYSGQLHTLIFNIARDLLIAEHRVELFNIYCINTVNGTWHTFVPRYRLLNVDFIIFLLTNNLIS